MHFLKKISSLGTFGNILWIEWILWIALEFMTPFLFVSLILENGYDRFTSVLQSSDNQFDFIIAGGGTTGAVIAMRLSEKYKVLVLEAGGTPHKVLNTPLLAFVTHGRFPVDWMYKTVPQENSSFGLNDNQTSWPSGKNLGGSSTINGMIYIRGSVQGFDIYANKTGDPAWSLENVLRYYTKIEDYYGHFEDNGQHGKGGRMAVGKCNILPCVKHWLNAGKEFGYKLRDPNSLHQSTEGYAPMDFYMRDGRRWDNYDGYIKPILGRPNLTVRKFAYVIKVLLDDNKKAIGVEYYRHGRNHQAFVNKEVILSAGSIQTPKILMHSGIGPKEHLTDIGIKPLIDLPVGKNLMDKYGALIGPFVIAEGNSFLRERDLTLATYIEYWIKGTGPWASTTAEGTFSIITDPAKKANSTKHPDIDLYILAQSQDKRVEVDYARSFNFRPEVLKNYWGAVIGKDSFMQLVTLAKPKGSGVLKLKDANPFSYPLIDPKYLSNRQDVDTLVEGIKFAVKLVEETESFGSINGSLFNMPFPGCEKPVFKSDAYYECLGRHTTLTAYKYCATAPMGKHPSDGISVVDSRLRVFGTTGLRVVDGSVLREDTVSINAVTVTMLGELASDFILDYWEKEERESVKKLLLNSTVLERLMEEELQVCAKREFFEMDSQGSPNFIKSSISSESAQSKLSCSR